MTSLGPFNLVDRTDLDATGKSDGHYATIGGQPYPLSAPASCGENCKTYWAYQPTHITLDSEITGSFENFGGFIFVDETKKKKPAFYEISTESSDYTMKFSKPFHILKAEFESCKNPARITLDGLAAQNYCWQPDGVRCPYGCFYY